MSTLAYFDASVWVASIMKDKDRYFPFANDSIGKMERGEIQVILNKLVLMETIHVIRMKTTKYERHDGSLDSKKSKEIKEKIMKKVQGFIDSTTTWESQGKLIIRDVSTPYDIFINEGFLHLFADFGEFGETDKCKKCKKPLGYYTYYYNGLGQWDFQHAMLAKSLQATEFYSTDNGFKHLRSNGNFSSINFIFPN